MKLFKVLLVCLSLQLMTGAAQAEVEDLGPAIGSEIPHKLTLKASSNKAANFEKLTGEKGLVIFFIRSADWCPFCQTQLIDINNSYKEITKKGYKAVAISYDSVEKLKSFKEKHEISFALLSDPKSESIKAFGVLNDEHKKGSDFFGVAKPITLITDAQGIVQQKYFAKEYQVRPNLDNVILNLP